jgi:hypothetical protein
MSIGICRNSGIGKMVEGPGKPRCMIGSKVREGDLEYGRYKPWSMQ